MVDKTKKKGGGKLNRTQTVTLRLDPRLRYLTDLAARAQRRTTSGFIEWAIEESLSQVEIIDGTNFSVSLDFAANSLWDVEEADRFTNLAIEFPTLLTHDEQVIWKLIKETLAFWTNDSVTVSTDPGELTISLNRILLREYWSTLKSVAEGNAP